MPQLGDTRVNHTDYRGEIVVEQFSYYNRDEPYWAVPAWEERGEGELAGPFLTVSEAREALARYEETWED